MSKEKKEDLDVIVKYAIKIANTNNFDGIIKFNGFKNKRASGSYLLHKVKAIKPKDFHFDNLYDMVILTKPDVLNNMYSDKVKELISYIQNLKL